MSNSDKASQLDLALRILSDLGEEDFISTKEGMWRWHSQGIWKLIEKEELKRIVQVQLAKYGEAVNKSLVEGVASLIVNHSFKETHPWNSHTETINLLNGELVRDGISWVLMPHNKAHYNTSQLMVNYDANQSCPRFRMFLDEIFMNDEDRLEKSRLLLELIGYSMTRTNRFNKFIILLGSGANGKSVLFSVLKSILGLENVASVSPNNFDNRFQRGYLREKYANIISEIEVYNTLADAELKAISSGDLITAEYKNKAPFSFTPFSTCWLGTNYLPHTKDCSDALFRRAIIIEFNNRFKEGENADPDLTKKLIAESDGIAALALGKYAEAIERDKLTNPRSCVEALKRWRYEADQVAMFLQECCEEDINAKITCADIFRNFNYWTKSSGIKSRVTKYRFLEKLYKMGFSKHRGKNGAIYLLGLKEKNILPESLFE